MVKPEPPARREHINIPEARPEQETIGRAEALAGESRTSFAPESADFETQQALLDQCFFELNEDDFRRVVELLNNPADPSPSLRRLLATAPPWERSAPV